MNITETISKELTIVKDLQNFKAGDNITVYYTIKEGDKQRTQFYPGVLGIPPPEPSGGNCVLCVCICFNVLLCVSVCCVLFCVFVCL